MLAIYKKELKNLFTNMTAAIFIGYSLLIIGIYTLIINFMTYYPNYEYTVQSVSLLVLLAVPILTMRSIAEERHNRTEQLLYSLPVTVFDIVLAKFLAMCTVLLVPVIVMSALPLILSMYGTVSFAASYSSILAFLLLGASFIAVGMFISSLTESQVIAAVLTLGVIIMSSLMSSIAGLLPADTFTSLIGFLVIAVLIALLMYFMTKSFSAAAITAAVLVVLISCVYLANSSLFEGAIAKVFSAMSVFDRFGSFSNGIFDITAIAYYASVISIFFFFTVQSMEKRRWS